MMTALVMYAVALLAWILAAVIAPLKVVRSKERSCALTHRGASLIVFWLITLGGSGLAILVMLGEFRIPHIL